MSESLVNLIAKRFIARPDVKAIQHTSGVYTPHVKKVGDDEVRIPWRREDLEAHLLKKQTFGHYLLNTDSQCKLFAFDIDLKTTGWLPNAPMPGSNQPGADPWASGDEIDKWESAAFVECNPREAWLDRSHPGRYWMKYQFRLLANGLMSAIHKELELPCAAAYTGCKGIHVYAFTGSISGHEAREGAQIVLDTMGQFEAARGNSFFKHKNDNPVNGYPNLSIEIFPKQDSLDGKDLGNLMRLPLGRNLKTKDPTFFIDMTAPVGELAPLDPEFALTTSNPWKRPGE